MIGQTLFLKIAIKHAQIKYDIERKVRLTSKGKVQIWNMGKLLSTIRKLKSELNKLEA